MPYKIYALQGKELFLALPYDSENNVLEMEFQSKEEAEQAITNTDHLKVQQRRHPMTFKPGEGLAYLILSVY